ncbi:MAG: hypothetical protein ACREJ0_28885, partial [Geminicoccaceae bacterium]
MKQQVNVLLAWTGAAIMLLGCTQDPVGTAPGGLEPSPSSQRSEDPDGPAAGGASGGASGGNGAQSDDADSDADGSGSSGSGSGDDGSG